MVKLYRHFQKNRHTYLMMGWISLVPVTMFSDLKYSVPFVVFMSLYANIESSAATRAAKKEKANPMVIVKIVKEFWRNKVHHGR